MQRRRPPKLIGRRRTLLDAAQRGDQRSPATNPWHPQILTRPAAELQFDVVLLNPTPESLSANATANVQSGHETISVRA
jgi:hypothetical protein